MKTTNERQEITPFLLGVQFMKDCCVFGTVLSNFFPSRDKMNLEDLNKIRKDLIDAWQLKNIEQIELGEFKQKLINNKIEVTDNNLTLFIDGILHWIKGQLLIEYMNWIDNGQQLISH